MNSKFPDFFESNLSYLREKHPSIHSQILGLQAESQGFFDLSIQGKLNYFIQPEKSDKRYLHDKKNPETEISHFLNMVPQESTGIVIMFGMGLGYTPEALLRQRQGIRHLIVFELNPSIFRDALKHRDLKFMLEDPRLVLKIGKSPDIQKIMESFQVALQLETVYTLIHKPSFDLDPVNYNKLYDDLYTIVNNYNVGGATTLAFGYGNLANRFANLPRMVHSRSIGCLDGKFKGVPAFLVAGGPSLNKNIHLLSLIKGRGILFAVDTVLPALVYQGVYPDFVGVLDPQPLTWEKLSDCCFQALDKKVSLICSDSVSPIIPKRFPAEHIFWVFSGKRISSWFNTLLGGGVLTAGAGTVAHLNLLSAVIMGCSPIVFVGQDLAYSKGASHVDNTVLTNRETLEEMLRTEKDMTWVKGIDGKPVKTSRGFAYMKDFFERVVHDHPGIYINATQGGAHIEGTEVLALKDVLHQYCTQPCDITIPEQLNSLPAPDSNGRSLAITAEFEKAMKKIKTIKRTISRAERLINECMKIINKKRGYSYCSFDDLSIPLKKKLKQIDLCNAEEDKENEIWQLLEELTMEGLRESERMKHKLINLENNPEEYEQWLVKSLERSSFINKVRVKVLQKFYDPMEFFLEYLKQEDRLGASAMDRIRLFFDHGDYVKAVPLLKTIEDSGEESSEMNFYLGALAAIYGEYKESDAYFSRAEILNFSMSKRISRFRKDLADQYLSYSETNEMDQTTVLRMLLKGLRYCRDHKKIQKKLKSMAMSDLEFFGKDFNPDCADRVKSLINLWYEVIKEDSPVLAFLEDSQLALFSLYYAKFYCTVNKPSKAKDALQRGMEFDRTNSDIHAMLAKIFFELQEFEKGVSCLNAAVTLDSRHGQLWEALGDGMIIKKQYGDALAAYEQFFRINPERADVLRKIGDCYLALDQTEAARDIYFQVKQLLLNKA